MHREVLQDALFGLFEGVVIGVEHRLSFSEVFFLLGVIAPRQRQHPLDVVTQDRSLSAHWAHHLELTRLALKFLAGHSGQVFLSDLRLKLILLAARVFATTAELLLNRLHLLIEIIVALLTLHLLFDVALDVAINFGFLKQLIHMRDQAEQALVELLLVEQAQLVLKREGDVAEHEIEQAHRVLKALKGALLLGEAGVKFGIRHKALTERLGELRELSGELNRLLVERRA